jgi:putative pyruvate formate lyase activating enzyme
MENGRFVIHSYEFEPAYLALYHSGELQRRAQKAIAGLANCKVCPRNCGVNRLEDQKAICKTGRYARVASYLPHPGEEACLRGWRGSGTIFFSLCNLQCVFCQSTYLSHEGAGEETIAEHLACMMLELQQMGCHNINLVKPEHVVPQILDALVRAVGAGLRLPIVYNTCGYDACKTLELLNGVVDIYLPDFKLWDNELSRRYVHAYDYPEVVQQALQEMYRQVGDLKFDEQGLAKRGLLVRHLIMPEKVAGTREIMHFLAGLSRDIYVNIMPQYRPDGKVSDKVYGELNRRISASEYEEAMQVAHQAGLWRLQERPLKQAK